MNLTRTVKILLGEGDANKRSFQSEYKAFFIYFAVTNIKDKNICKYLYFKHRHFRSQYSAPGLLHRAGQEQEQHLDLLGGLRGRAE